MALLPWGSVFNPESWHLLEQFYALLKPAILWAPLGLIAGLTGYGKPTRLVGIAIPFLLLAISPLASISLDRSTVIEILAVLPGLAMGLWLGERSKVGGGETVSAISGRDEPIAAGLTATQSTGFPLVIRRAGAIVLLAFVGGSLLDFPVGGLALGVGYIACFALFVRFPKAWLIVVPAALPLFDFAFWSGRFFFDEFDRLVLVAFAAWLWCRPVSTDFRAWPAAAWLLVLSVIVSTLVALLPWQPLDPNAFSSYWSQYNGVRVAKGFLWGALLFLMARPALIAGDFRWLAAGMTLGLAGVSLAALWESWLFTGFGTASDYRATATFSSMHTGGGHIEAYLACAATFVGYLAVDQRRWWVRGMLMMVFLLAAYAILTTVARGGLIAFLLASVLLGILFWRGQSPGGKRFAGIAILAAGLMAVLGGLSVSVFFQQRIAQTATDAGTRLSHWTETVGMMRSGVRSWLVGEGLGSFPRQFLFAHPDLPLGNYRINQEGGNAFLSLNSGGTLYMAQAVAARPNTAYTVTLDVRSDGRSKALEFSLCEKILFNSHRCQWGNVAFQPVSGAWHSLKFSFNSGAVGAGSWLHRRPVQFSLYNGEARTVVDVDNVRLIDAPGNNLLANGDFNRGLDRWFFKSGDHLPWHAKNLWVHLLLEQGVLGVLACVVLTVLALFRLFRSAWEGNAVAATMLAALVALLVLSMVDSLVDVPRLTTITVFLLLLGAAWRVPSKSLP